MLKKRKLLPPLDYLLAFEAAAQLGSFARASEQLNISETAISRKVRLLEQHYDLPLFVRGHRSITLTSHGVALLNSVNQSLDILRNASEGIFARHKNNAVTLAATNSVAALWLMPRLRTFQRSNTRVKIMLMASDSDEECLSDEMDLSILRGDGDWPGFDAQLLFGETVFPVCSPGYLKRNPGCSKLRNLPEMDLIEVSSSHTEWMDWRTWLGHQGIEDVTPERSAFFNTYPLLIQAAVDGLGVALGWGHLVDHLLESGELVRPVQESYARTESGYFLLRNRHKKTFAEQEIVEDWLIRTSEARRRFTPPRAE
ncbi:LysR substrate-binding domain-containing protein [Primorskyibacter sp. S87]|uniref:LysR substrate-binding domain-containing protein n=1 Tax=Primorskyibacter sp. S87 TaxID=3415126 RepID=UPI003C7B3CDF